MQPREGSSRPDARGQMLTMNFTAPKILEDPMRLVEGEGEVALGVVTPLPTMSMMAIAPRLARCKLRDAREDARGNPERSDPADGGICLRMLVEGAPVAMRVSRNAVTIWANRGFLDLFGYQNRNDVVGRPVGDIWSPASRSSMEEWLKQRSNRASGPCSFEGLAQRADGTQFHAHVEQSTVDLPDGPATLTILTNITERKQAEERLRKSEEHFRILVEQAPEGIFIADSTGRYLDVNSAGAGMLGYTREEIRQLAIPDVVAEEERDRIAEEVGKLNNDQIVRSEWRFRRKDGSTFPGEVYGQVLPDGRLQAILCDITERKRAEDILRESEQRFKVALADSPIAVFSQDRSLRYTWIHNPHLFWRKDIIGKTDEELLGAERASHILELKRKVLEQGTGLREEFLVTENGKNHFFDLTLEPLFDSERNVVGLTGASVDIARLRELADSLQLDKEKLVREKSYLEGEIQSELGFEEIIGRSPALRDVLKKARVVAPTDSTVLLLGETGTGKELVARSIHALSSRSGKNFIKLNCAAVPTGLLESELFGHEKGAFTGAVSQKIGRLELADKGTLFLDEVGELPPELQPKLLRVLQDREFERLGGIRTLHVDVRIISATNRDLKKEASEKKFREDLFYRLNVFPIELPPLRERRGDIRMLVRYFVSKHAARMGKKIERIPSETMEVFERWAWPGNIRELENVIERMVILSKEPALAPPPAELTVPQQRTLDSFAEMERDHIIRVLRETNGVVSGAGGAAGRLGVKRTALQSMLKRFKIRAEEYREGPQF